MNLRGPWSIVAMIPLLLSSCSNHSGSPKDLSPFVVNVADAANTYDVPLPGDPGFLAEALTRYGLKPLSEANPKQYSDRYRFLWTRSFHKTALFEMNFSPDGTGVFVASVWEEVSGKHQWVQKRSLQLEEATLKSNHDWIARGKYFELPFNDNRQGLDGAGWLIEVKQDNKYHAVYRWSPEDGFIREFGRTFIEMSIESRISAHLLKSQNAA
jgi:hypothetical protein